MRNPPHLDLLTVKPLRLALSRLGLIVSAIVCAQMVNAACDIQIVSSGPCLTNSTYGVPQVGETYGIKAVINIIGTPAHPFRIRQTLANITNYSGYMTLGAGTGYWWWFEAPMALDDPIPWSFTVDPDGVSGNTNAINSVASGIFTPIPPATSVELYSPQVMQGWETCNLNFQPGSGTIGNLWVLFGDPTSHGAQQAIYVPTPKNAQSIVTAPYGLPLFEIARTNVSAQTFLDSNAFVVQLSSMRVNPTLLRTVTWSDLDSMTTNWTQWLSPDPTCESTNAAVASFVQQSLPANYQSSLTPYDTARTLHRAVMKKLTYESPPPCDDAVGVLEAGFADCAGFAALLTSCLRYVGIPARTISGFWEGDTQWHCRVEFHLPGVEWVMADPTVGNTSDPTGTYAYEFGDVPDANEFVTTDVGDQHLILNNDFGGISGPNWWWNGGAVFNSYTAQSSLQLVGATGELRTTIIPSAVVTAGAQWQLVGGSWQNSGSTVSNLPPGIYVVTFTPVSGWITPANQTVTITTNQTATATGTYGAMPTVVGVSSSAPNGAYGAGATIPITVTFSDAVTAEGAPSLTLNAGGGATACYASGGGTSNLSFTYVVADGQNSTHLDYASISALALNGGAIQDSLGNNAILSLSAPGTPGSLGADKDLVIDTQGPALIITSPANNATVTSASLLVSGTATDNGYGNDGVSSVTANGVSANAGTASGTGTANWNAMITLTSGTNTITAVAKDTLNNSAQQQITVIYNASGTTPGITNPPPGSMLPSSSVTFQWSGGTGAPSYMLDAGSNLGAADYYGQYEGDSLSATVSGLPTDGSLVYVRFWWATATPGWQYADFTYTAFSQNTQPTFGCWVVGDGQLQATLSGLSSGETLVLEASSDLRSWTAIQTNISGGPTLTCTNVINPTLNGQFFRARVP
jgi:transglutaminase-like putative cysteine protease